MPSTLLSAAEPFELFGPAHLAALGVIAALTSGFIVALRLAAKRRPRPPLRRPICWTLAAVVIGELIYVEIYRIATGTWHIHDSMPLHLCDIAHFAVAAALYAAGRGIFDSSDESKRHPRWKTVFELAYYWGLAGTGQALITPDLSVAFPSPGYFHFFSGHGAIVAGVLVMVVGLRIYPGPRSALRAWAMTNLLVPPIMLFNWLTNSNYMFLSGPPSQPSIYDYFGPWPWSLLTMELVALLIMTACYSPFWVLRRRGHSSNLVL